MIPSIYLITSSLPGSLILMPKPSSEWLKEDMGYLQSIGVNAIVSMLEKQEAIELKLDHEQEVCNQMGLDFTQLEVQDRCLPEYESFKNLVNQVVNKLKIGGTVAVHCRAGIGRSGMVVCCAMLDFGHTAITAIELVSKQRGVCVPDTAEQREFIEEYELKMRES